MAKFDIYGPFTIAVEQGKCQRSQIDLWQQADDALAGLSSAIGCYMFCLDHKQSLVPWYAGMTTAKAGFYGECFTDHKTQIVDDLLKSYPGKPVAFLFPFLTRSRRLSDARTAGKRPIALLEKALMAMAYSRNAKLANIRDMRFLKNLEIPGLFGPDKEEQRSDSVTNIRRALLGG